ncbi:hypothetical protein [Maribacter sp. 2-571]|uniref:hypothetical protein n=1 Tax=Maribacter sp. 2-571 TaxID=3417569 RepID=UPI003D34CD2D
MKKTMKLTRTFFSALFVASLLFACSPEDGEDGAMGVQGEQGPQGAAGADGAQGEQGEVGSANVIYSGWIPSEFDNNIIATSDSFLIDAPEMTNDFIEQGIILVYGRSTPNPITIDTDVFSLPIVFGVARQQSYYFRVEQAGELYIAMASTVEGQSAGVPFFSEYRYILIPGGQTTSGKATPLDYTKMTYQELTEHFGIEE